MSACCRRITAGTAASTAAMSQIQLRRAEVLQLPREFVVTDRRREIVLRSSSRRRWVMEAVGLRSDGGGGVEEEKKIRPCSYAVGDQRAVGNLVGGGDGEVVAEAGGGVEGDRTVEVLVAAGVTVVLGVGNRVLYKLALVPLKHYPFFLAQLATFFRIPTFVVDPLPDGLDRGYIVQWLEKATIEEEYILMAEPGHVFVNPLPNLAYGDQPVAFPFFYIRPAENEKIVRKYYPKENGLVTEIDPIGNSLVIIKKSILENIAPTWMNISLRMKDDPETDKAFGWVLEMYAYAVASALHGVRHTLRKDFMIQVCMIVGKNFIIHYTYGCDYNMKGQLTYGKIGEWRFDKRSYLRGPPPRNLPLPPPGVLESVARLVKMVNEATANIPGWDKL